MSGNLSKRLPEADLAEDRMDDSLAIADVDRQAGARLMEILERMETDVRVEREAGDRARKQG